jgi:hypothetical protein
MAVIPEPERSRIYTRLKHQLGAPLRSVELENEMLDSLMELSIEDYEQYVLDWLIESQWTNLVNLNMSEKSVANALITRTLNFEDQFTYAYSKIVGLQTVGPWILKQVLQIMVLAVWDWVLTKRVTHRWETLVLTLC